MKKFTPRKDRIEYGGAMIGKAEREAVMRVLDSHGGRRWTLGPESEAFEKELAHVAGVNHAVVTNSGSSALLIAIAALKLPKGSKIVIPAVNFPTAFNAIIQNGHIPVVVDVDLETLNLSLADVAKAIRILPDIAAVIAVDIAGNPVDIPALRQIVGWHRYIVLDNCDGFGTLLGGVMIDHLVDVSCASFHAAHIITMGEGGAVMTNNMEIANVARKMREWGRASGTDEIYEYPGFPDDYKARYVYEEIGYNMKPLELQCAMGRVQLKRLEEFRTKRLNNYNVLSESFNKTRRCLVVKNIQDTTPCWFSFPILVKNRKKVMAKFEANNVETRTIFSGNVLRHPAYKHVDYIQVSDLHNSDIVMRDGMFLSVHPSLTLEMLEFMGSIL